ncbi:MAG: AAA family ATPase [Nanoarchaeota archaeon]|nr:AAA family ATPase [Nanoarchaeota archaeon]
MKISSLEIQNIKSVGDRIQLHFEQGINIFIGPNGSGKSNVMDILNTVLHTYFIWHWHENIEPFGKTTYQKQNLDGFFDLPKHFDSGDTKPQEISIEIEFSDDDLENIKIIRDHLSDIAQTEKDLLKQQTSDIENIFNPLLTNAAQDKLGANRKQKFIFNAQKLDQNGGETQFNTYSNEQKLWFRYLNYLEKVKYLIEKYNEERADSEKIRELKFNFKFFSPNRFHEGQQFEISLPGQSRTQKLKEIKQKTSKNTTSDIAYSTYYFARIFNSLAMRNQLLREDNKIGADKKFQDDPQVKEVKSLLSTIGSYDFQIEVVSAEDNKFQFKIISGGQETDFKNLSSGEKEVLNFIFILLALDLKDACVLIDEPEIHLHPQWQNKLIKLFRKLHTERNIQFIISTHSPVFVNRETIANIFRIYKPKKQTQITPEEKTDEWKKELEKEEDLIDIITYSNNSKLFFANKVVLVEGITDEIIFSYLIRTLGKDEESIEVVNVNGKDSFPKYIKFLSNFKIIPTVICDLDNLWNGELLKGQTILEPLKNKITEFWKQREKGLSDLSPYLNTKTVKEKITNRDIGEKVLEIIKKIKNKEEISEDDQKFIEAWLEKCVDKKKIFDELKIDEIYSETDNSITSLEKLCEKIANGSEISKVQCPVYVIKEGTIENYDEGIKHSKNGAFKLLNKIKIYIEKNKIDDPKIEELKIIVSKILE